MSVSPSSQNKTANQQLMSDEVRAIVIRELRAENLTKEKQDLLMRTVGEALTERATLELLKKVPPEVLVELGMNDQDPSDTASAALFMQRVAQHVPDAEAVIIEAIKAGLRDYQKHLDTELAKT